jgi:hypothetical protein
MASHCLLRPLKVAAWGLLAARVAAKEDEVAMPTVLECTACDVPPALEIPFCSEFVPYSACRTGDSWKTMVRPVL